MKRFAGIALGLLMTGMLIGASAPATASISGGGGGSVVVGATSTPDGTKGWTVTANGAVSTTGSAHRYGDLVSFALHAPVVGIAATPTGSGYWLLAADGGVFSFGSASFYGSTGGMRLNQPIVGMSTQPAVKGYWLVASDGGVFPFGAARFEGSTGAIHLVQPVRAIAATRTGRGYWLAAADGGIFAFGDAHFYGSTAGSCVGVVGIIPTTKGYIIAGEDGSLREMDSSTAQAPSSCPTSACPSSYIDQVVQITNAQRAAHGLPALHVSGQLAWAANRRSVIQATNNAMNHDGWETVIRASGYPSGGWSGENVAAGFTSGDSVMSAWMGSTGHRDNILHSYYTDIGVGCAYSRSHVAYWTQDFGSPS